jgi:hypothetical protein
MLITLGPRKDRVHSHANQNLLSVAGKKVLQTEPNNTYRKYKETAHRSLVALLVS